MSIRKELIVTILLLTGFSAGCLVFDLKNPRTTPQMSVEEIPYACPVSKEAVESAYAQPLYFEGKAQGVIVNHHLLAAGLIAQNFQALETEEPITIVLVSPNHFSMGKGQLISSDRDWEACHGPIRRDEDLTRRLAAENLVNIDEVPFVFEHGIYNLLPFVKKSFPNARVVPIIIKETAGEEQLEALADKLANYLPENSLVIGSFDFSHETTNELAEKQDKASVALIESMDSGRVGGVKIDSQKGLWLVMEYSKRRGAEAFQLTANTNAAKLTGDLASKYVTSYVTGVFTSP